MQALVKVFWDIALWRRGPRDVPASPLLLALTVAAYSATSVAQSLLVDGPELLVLRTLVDLALTMAMFGACLLLTRRTHRLLQTLTAVLGTSALLALPMILLQLAGRQAGPDGPVALLLELLSLPLLAWYVLVLGHVVRQALDAPLVTGLAVAMSYVLVNYLVLIQLPKVAG
jgi:hypothetical protein